MTELKSVKLERHFRISSKKLFELLSTPRYMQQWFYPSDEVRMQVIAQKFEVGGQYRFHYVMPNGETHVVVGEYCAIDDPNLIAFTWGWEEPDEHADIETLVTLSLADEGEGTRLSVLHEQLLAGDMYDRHEAGWCGTLDNLKTVVGKENT